MKTKQKFPPDERLRATTLNIGESQWEWLMEKNRDIGVRPSVTIRKLIKRAMEAEAAVGPGRAQVPLTSQSATDGQSR